MILDLERYRRNLEQEHLEREIGRVVDVVGSLIVGYLPGASIGTMCRIYSTDQTLNTFAEVVGFRDSKALLMPLGSMQGIAMGSMIEVNRISPSIKVGPELLGRVINGMGLPLDKLGPLESFEEKSLYEQTVNPLDREPIDVPLDLGVKTINGLITVGEGQRVAIMAGSGVGKSVLLGMMARSSNADVNVIAMIGERGREVREFVEDILGEEGLKKSVVVVATSDESPLLRMRGAFAATSIAEYFSSQGKKVLLMMDSVTRFAMAQREVGLSSGEPPASKGYTPSVFSLLPKLLERAGRFEHGGSITGLYTVLVEGDDMDEPIADAVRSIVDGHIVLDRKIAHKGMFPAIDALKSASRVMNRVTSPEHQKLALKMREMMAVYKEAEDLINIGAYRKGTNPKIDDAIELKDRIDMFLKQSPLEKVNFQDSFQFMRQIVG